jgi:hypothetical protein
MILIRALWGICLCALTPALAPAAGNLQINVASDRTKIGLQDSVTVTVTFSGSEAQNIATPRIGFGDNFRVVGTSRSQNFNFINGQSSVTNEFIYTLLPVKVGKFSIGPFSFQFKGETIATNAIEIEVVQGTLEPPQPQGQQGQGLFGEGSPFGNAFEGRRGGAREGRVFLTTEVSNSKPYVGEQVSAKVKLYTDVRINGIVLREEPSLDGFWKEEVPVGERPQATQTQVEGRTYQVFEIKKMILFPTKAGKLTIPAIPWDIRVFTSDFFFGSTRVITRQTQPVELEALPIPEKDRPAGFNGAVGSYQLSASVDNPQVKVNEAVTLKVTIAGKGNLRTVEKPDLPELPDFKSYISKTTENIKTANDVLQGARTWEYVLIPRAPGDQVIPAVSFSFFNPGKRSFETASTRPVRLVVEKGAPMPPTGETLAVNRREVKEIRRDINYIKALPAGGLLTQVVAPVSRGVLLVLVVVPLVLNGVAFVYRRERRKLEDNQKLARQKRALSEAQQKIRQAGRLPTGDSSAVFYGLLSDAITGFVADKCDAARAGLTSDRIAEMLGRGSLKESDVKKTLGFLELCDYSRFAPGSRERRRRKEDLLMARNLLKVLERALR